MFQREEHGGRFLGYSLHHKNLFFLFGSRHLSKNDLMLVYPEYEYAFLKQVHGQAVVSAEPSLLAEADAHFTRRATRAPVVQTADCVPVLLASKSQVCGIHAGWRGVAQNIVSATRPLFRDEKILFAAIGPHILRDSFEIGREVANQLLSSAPAPSDPARYLVPHSSPDKTYFDLTQLVRDQLAAAFGKALTVFECLHDTKTSPDFHSFRRDKDQAGRQYSFVVINS